MIRRFGLRDDQWERIEGLLPGREGSVGVTAADNRLFVEAVLYRYRTGMPWRDLPERGATRVEIKPITVPQPNGAIKLGAGAAEMTPNEIIQAAETTKQLIRTAGR